MVAGASIEKLSQNVFDAEALAALKVPDVKESRELLVVARLRRVLRV